jgi:hypothetical protein
VLGEEQLGDLGPSDRAVAFAPRDRLTLLDLALHHAQQRQATEVGRRVEVGDPCLQGCALVVGRCRDVVEEDLDEIVQPLLLRGTGDDAVGLVEVERGPPVTARAVDDRELDLVFLRVEIEEEFVHLVDDLERARVRSVHLVDHEDHRQIAGEGLAQHEPCLRQGPFGSIDEQHDAVDHGERPLDLAAEVGVSGGVDDVQRDVVTVAGVAPHQ